MAEEFEGGVCGGNWSWNSSRNLFGSSPCSLASNDIRSFGNWSNHDPLMEMKATRSSTDDSAGSASDASSSIQLLQDVQKPNGMDSNIQMMGISLSSSTSTNDANWNHDFLHESGRSEENYSNILQGENINYSINNSFKQVDQSYPDHLEQQQMNSTELSCASAASTGFPLNSASYGYTSSLLQTLFDTDSDQTQQSNLLDNQPAAMNNYSSSCPANYNNHNQVDSNEFLPGNRLPFTNNAPLWNASAAALCNIRASFLPSAQTQFVPSSVNNSKSNFPSSRAKHQNEAAKKASNEPAFKRPRMETPSPLPTFKVRKEKLGDRVTALQQLVSPFGKTDTASVLHEAIEYIKFLHDQVSALSTPYLKNGSPPVQRQQIADKLKDEEGLIQDLKSRGLCLVPISSTFPVAAETSTDFWIPTFGASFK